MTERLAWCLLLGLLMAGCGGSDDDDDASSSDDCTDIAAAQEPPRVEISAPANSSRFSVHDTINFVAQVSDQGTDLTEITLDLTDVINVTPEPVDVDPGSPDDDGDIAFSVPGGTLEAGEHVLRLRATDPDGCTGRDDVFVCVDTVDCLD